MLEIVIKEIIIAQNEESCCDARELHAKLKVRRDFSTWIKGRIDNAQLIVGEDFIRSPILVSDHKIEYTLTLDAAKHIAMLEKTEIGKEIRRYFIQVEKKAKHLYLQTKTFKLLPIIEQENATRVLKAQLTMAELLKVPEHLAQIEAAKTVKQICNVDCSPLLLQAPAQSNLKEEDIFLEPTELGVRLNLGSGIKTNKILNELGLQIKISRTWVPTKKGVEISSIHQWNRGGKSGDNLKWNLTKVKELL